LITTKQAIQVSTRAPEARGFGNSLRTPGKISLRSSASGLEFDEKSYPDILQSARFLKFIGKIWKIVSVKTPSKGVHVVAADIFCVVYTSLSHSIASLWFLTFSSPHLP